MSPLPTFLILLHLLAIVSSASNPTSFCKCICGSNSTIIPLDAPSADLHARSSFSQSESIHGLPLARREENPSSSDPPADKEKSPKEGDDKSKGKDNKEKLDGDKEKDESGEKKKEYRKKTCNDCNKQYCLNQGLHICEGKALEDVFTTCFQRDSRKDEAVVFIFIFATAGLLGWAAVKPWIDRKRERRAYIPVHGGEGD